MKETNLALSFAKQCWIFQEKGHGILFEKDKFKFKSVSNFFFDVYLFLRERERDSVWVGEGAEREGDTEPKAGSRLWAVSTEPDVGLELTSCEIITWAEVSRLMNWATKATQSVSNS